MGKRDCIQAFGFAIWHGHPEVASGTRRHDELEMVLVTRGDTDMQIGASIVTLCTGALGVFWALTSHQIVRIDPVTMMYRLTIPLPDFLQWQLPPAFARHLLDGQIVLEEKPAKPEHDRALFKKWMVEFAETSLENRTILRLEIEARSRRVARADMLTRQEEPGWATETPVSGEIDRAMLMARHIAEHYTEPLHDADIARPAGLNVQYAIRLFSKTFGISMHKHLNKYRIAHACRLLETTNKKVIDVALDAGFGSLSRFYECFSRACGQSPHEFRAGLQPASGTESTG